MLLNDICRKALILLTILLSTTGWAQVNYATSVNLEQKIKAASLQKGDVLLHREKGKFHIYGTFAQGTLTAIWAIDELGRRRMPTTAAISRDCDICFRAAIGKLYCYDVDCKTIAHLKPHTVDNKVKRNTVSAGAK